MSSIRVDSSDAIMNSKKNYVIIAAECWAEMAQKMVLCQPHRFQYFPTKWAKFQEFSSSEMDDIEIGGFYPENKIQDANIVFLASFHNNDVTLAQLNVLVVLLESFVAELTVVLPFFPMGTMERVDKEGQVATANTIGRLLSNLPFCGRPSRVMIYDIHALTTRFYIQNSSIAVLQTAMPLLHRELKTNFPVDAVAFPDEGAFKRFHLLFEDFDTVVCGKVRDGNSRRVTIQEGAENAKGKRVIIVDDLVRSGGTLYECGKALREIGASSVSAFCTHADFSPKSWQRFTEGQDRFGMFEKFFVTDSCPLVTNLLHGVQPFHVLSLLELMLVDLP